MFKEHQPTLSASTGTARIGRPWRALLVVLALALAFSTMALASEDAQAKKKKKTKAFSQQDAAQQADYPRGEADGAPINDPTDPFTFRKTQKIVSLNRVGLVFTVRPAPGSNFDPDELTLALDGINTRLEATESSSDANGNLVLVFSGAPANASSILAALKADARLQATLIDDGNNELTISDNFDTVLTIKGKIRR